MIGQTFGKLTVAGEGNSSKVWDCKCSCGRNKKVKESNLISGHTKSCGCLRKTLPVLLCMTEKAVIKNRKLVKGMRFSRLVITEVYPTLAVCDCGNTVVVTRTSLLFNGSKKSCGCLNKDVAREKARKRAVSQRIARGAPPNEKLASANLQLRNQFRELSKEIKKEDGFTCVLCKNRGGRLNVHHIVPWAKDEKLRFNRSNLVTLCRKCHIERAHNGNVHGPVDETIKQVLLEYTKIREWSCVECGTLHDRDINAAKNILALGHKRLAGGSSL